MSDLSAALREAGHEDMAARRKKGAGRKAAQGGRHDLADALITGEQTPPAEEAEPATESTTPPAAHEQLAERLNAAQSKWLTLGGPGGSDG
jgi:hypothetical protein